MALSGAADAAISTKPPAAVSTIKPAEIARQLIPMLGWPDDVTLFHYVDGGKRAGIVKKSIADIAAAIREARELAGERHVFAALNGVRRAFKDKGSLDDEPAVEAASYAMQGPDGSIHLIHVADREDGLAGLLNLLHEYETDDVSVFDDVPLPYGDHALRENDAARLARDEDFKVYTRMQIEAALLGGLDEEGDAERTTESILFDTPEIDKELHQTDTFNDAEMYGELSADLLDRKLAISIGKNQSEKKWKTYTEITFAQFLANKLTKHLPGDKDGECFVTGAVADGLRSKNSVTRLSMLGLDVDSGESLQRTAEKIRSLGLSAAIYTTHSHLTTELSIKQDGFWKWATDNGYDTDPSTELVQKFLTWEGKYVADVIASAEYVKTAHDSKGMRLLVQTRPIDKFRLIFPLETDYIMAEQKMAQREAILKWEGMVMGMGAMLGISVDRAARDPSRLFFLPRHKKGSTNHRILVIAGRPLDWTTIEAVDPRGTLKSDPFDQAAHVMGARMRGRLVTDGGIDLNTWAYERADGFMISEVLKAFCDDKIRVDQGNGKFTIECPFDDDHSNAGDPEDPGCFSQDAGMDAEQWTTRCSHNSCQGRDRLQMLDKMLKDGWFPEDVLTDDRFDCMDREEGDKAVKGGDDEGDPVVDAPETDTSSKVEPITKEELRLLRLMADGPKRNQALGKIKAKALAIADGFTTGTLEQEYKGLIEQTLDLSPTDASAIDRKVAKRIAVAPSVVSNLRRRVEDEAAKDEEMGKPRVSHDDGDEKITDVVVKALVDDMANRIRFVIHDEAMKYVLTPEDREEDGGSCVPSKRGVMLEAINANDFWSRCADMVSYRTGSGKSSRDEWLPERIANKIRGAANKPFAPRIKRVVKHPIFTKDGDIKLTTGFDRETKLLIDLAGLSLDIDLTKKLTKDDSDDAVAVIEEVFGEFPFAGYSSADAGNGKGGSIARLLALLISPLMREVHNGYAPIFVIDKPTAGTGASLLMEVIHLIWTGEEPGASQWPKDDEPEVRKAITGMLKASVACIFFDNIKNFVGGASLPTLATGMWRDRELGGNTIYESLLECPVVLAANNIKLSYENSRRSFPIRLDANMERPSQGRDFTITDLKGHVLKNRSEIIKALITMIRWWFQNGRKPLERSDKTPGSFEKFCDVIGGVLVANDVHGLLDGLDEFYAAMADEKATVGAFMQALVEEFGLNKPFGSADAFPVAFKLLPKKNDAEDDRYELIFNGIGISPKLPTYELQKQRLGAILSDFKDGVHTLTVDAECFEVKFVDAGKTNGSNRWQFVRVVKPSYKAPKPGAKGG